MDINAIKKVIDFDTKTGEIMAHVVMSSYCVFR